MIIHTRPELTTERIDEIKQTITDNPEMGRSKISQNICEKWNWRTPAGYKDIACRDMLRKLERNGIIKLPPAKNRSRTSSKKKSIKHLAHENKPITNALTDLLPLRVEIINGGMALNEFKSLIDQYHYLKFDRAIGENMKYMIYERGGQPVACMLFGSAAWSCADRDKYIGWDKTQRKENLMYITANTRFLILPGVSVPYLASHILSIITKRISKDWEGKYGHCLYAMETYVDKSRYRGVCYRAANWVHVGRTTGRGRDGGHHNAIIPEKDVYIYPLAKKFKKKLAAQERAEVTNEL